MIYDRPYMQDDFRPTQVPVIKWILLTTIGVFVLQAVFATWFKSPFVEEFFALSTIHLGQGFVWTLVTYAFLHGGVLHILGNMLIVFFIGRELVPLLGAKRFMQLYFAAAAVGGLFWLGFGLATGPASILVGASASALGLLTVFACIYPNKPITLLLFFIIPVTIRPKYIVYGILAFSLFGLLFLELPAASDDNIAHSAHLGGMLMGWLFFHFVHARPERPSRNETRVEPPSWFKKKKPSRAGSGSFSVNITNRQILKKEVDRILDKINSKGFGSLSEEEKKVLDRARDLLSK